MVNIDRLRKNLLGYLTSLGEYGVGVPVGIDAQGLMEVRSLMVTNVHSRVNSRLEKLDPVGIYAAG